MSKILYNIMHISEYGWPKFQLNYIGITVLFAKIQNTEPFHIQLSSILIFCLYKKMVEIAITMRLLWIAVPCAQNIVTIVSIVLSCCPSSSDNTMLSPSPNQLYIVTGILVCVFPLRKHFCV